MTFVGNPVASSNINAAEIRFAGILHDLSEDLTVQLFSAVLTQKMYFFEISVNLMAKT